MGIIGNTYNRIQNLIYYVVITGLGIFGAVMIITSISDLISGELELGAALFVILISLIPLGFPLLVVREKVRDKRLINWLVENMGQLGEGVEGPDGEIYSFDTKLVRYRANLSLVFVSTDIESGFYLSGSNHLLPKTLYTLFTTFFGWWIFDYSVWLDNIAAIATNLGNSNTITVGEMFESAVEEQGVLP